MAQTTVVKVKIQELTKYGFKANDRYVGLSKNLSEADKTKLVPGAELEAEFYIADSGKEYLNKIVGQTMPSTQPKGAATPSTAVDVERAKRFTPKFTKKKTPDNSMSKEEWAAKDQRISRQGVIQAAVIALAPVVSLDILPEEAKKLATSMLEFVKGA